MLSLTPVFADASSNLLAARSQMGFTLGFHIVLACLGVAFPAVMLIADFIYSPTLTIVTGVIAIGVYGMLWYVLPLIGPRGPRPDEAQS